MADKTAQLLKSLSFAILVQDIDSTAPSYLLEKWRMVKNSTADEVLAMLDPENQERVLEWGEKWDVDMSAFIERMLKDKRHLPHEEFLEVYGGDL